MSNTVLITGGAGFIGSHLADRLLRDGHRVRALDCLSTQVHGDAQIRPDYLDERVELQVGDVRDPDAVAQALDGVSAVFHLAAAVGVGQSMYQIAEYTAVNNLGTAVLLEAIIKQNKKRLARPVQKLVVASSMSIYGEGLYTAPDGSVSVAEERDDAQLRRHDWEVRNTAGEVLTPLPTPETKTPTLASVYALSKYDQERLCMMTGRAYGIPTVALRFFNVYGTRQALSNPYTGVLAIFASRLLNDKAPMIFEDGLQQRDFVSVYDVVQGLQLALEKPEAAGQVFNIGSGKPRTIRSIAQAMANVMGRPITPEITGRYRVGDIRHCVADITLARRTLGYAPSMDFQDGLEELAGWLATQTAEDRVDAASAELAARGLAI